MIVGAYSYNNGQLGEGRAFVYQGSASGLGGAATWTAESDQVGAFFGLSVSTAGDVNGDGFSDVIVGAELFDNGQPKEGRAFVYLGSASGLGMPPDDDFSVGFCGLLGIEFILPLCILIALRSRRRCR